MIKTNYVVFTDLDGTLLDHETYEYEPAEPALALLKARGIPLILASSKTAAEIAPLRAQLGFTHCPAIVENGAGILPAHVNTVQTGANHARLLETLSKLPHSLLQNFEGFSQWSAAQVQDQTGLPMTDAKLAKQRDFSEPGLWLGSKEALDDFRSALADHDIIAQQGGRFLTLSFGGNKSAQMQNIINQFKRQTQQSYLSIALGDAPNDVQMLECANKGIVIPNPAHESLQPLNGELRGTISRATLAGPAGWCESILDQFTNADFINENMSKE